MRTCGGGDPDCGRVVGNLSRSRCGDDDEPLAGVEHIATSELPGELPCVEVPLAQRVVATFLGSHVTSLSLGPIQLLPATAAWSCLFVIFERPRMFSRFAWL